jgi:hypothetical protein
MTPVHGSGPENDDFADPPNRNGISESVHQSGESVRGLAEEHGFGEEFFEIYETLHDRLKATAFWSRTRVEMVLFGGVGTVFAIDVSGSELAVELYVDAFTAWAGVKAEILSAVHGWKDVGGRPRRLRCQPADLARVEDALALKPGA